LRPVAACPHPPEIARCLVQPRARPFATEGLAPGTPGNTRVAGVRPHAVEEHAIVEELGLARDAGEEPFSPGGSSDHLPELRRFTGFRPHAAERDTAGGTGYRPNEGGRPVAAQTHAA